MDIVKKVFIFLLVSVFILGAIFLFSSSSSGLSFQQGSSSGQSQGGTQQGSSDNDSELVYPCHVESIPDDFNKLNYSLNLGKLGSLGEFVLSNDSFVEKNYIMLSGSCYYVFHYIDLSFNFFIKICFYDINKDLIETFSTFAYPDEDSEIKCDLYVRSIPLDACYMRFSFYQFDSNDVVTFDTDGLSSFPDYVEIYFDGVPDLINPDSPSTAF